MRLIRKSGFAWLVLALVLLLAACSKKSPVGTTEAPLLTETSATGKEPTAAESGPTAYPGPGIVQPTLGIIGRNTYPGPGQEQPSQAPTTANGYPGPGEIGQEVTPSANENSTQVALAPTSTPTPSATPTEVPASPTATTASEADSETYPGPGEAQQMTPTSEGAYPPPGQGQPTLPPTYNPYPEPGQESEVPPTETPGTMYTPTPTFPSGVNTPTPAPGNQTSTFTPTPSITPTPTPSTPTATPTLDPELHDTDPKTVVLASGKVQMVEFFTFWCLPCRAMGPVMNRLEGQYGNRMNFIFLDTDNPETMDLQHALEYRIPTYGMEPQFYLLDKQGKILKHWIGPVSEQELRGTIETALNP